MILRTLAPHPSHGDDVDGKCRLEMPHTTAEAPRGSVKAANESTAELTSQLPKVIFRRQATVFFLLPASARSGRSGEASSRLGSAAASSQRPRRAAKTVFDDEA